MYRKASEEASAMKVVIASPLGTPEEYAPIIAAGHEIVFGRAYGDRRPYTDAELIDLTKDADILISIAANRKLLESAPKLRAVVGPVIGYERIDVKAATDCCIV